MLTVYKTVDNKLTILDKPEKGCWISVVEPNAEEISYLRDSLGILPEFIRSALDEEETAHVDAEPDENQTLIMFDASVEDSTEETVSFTTMPLGVIFTEPYIVTIAQRRHLVLEEMAAGMMRGLQTNMKTRFFLRMMMRVTSGFLSHLRRIDKLSSMTEQQLHRTMRNQELMQLMGLQKSLVYFSSSLKANDAIFQRVSRGKLIKMYEEDEDLMEDLLIEMRQAIEMCSIYTGVLASTQDTVASIISNNLNIVMKVMAAASIILTIPTMVFSFYGMNTPLPMPNAWFPLLLAALLTSVTIYVLIRKGMFR